VQARLVNAEDIVQGAVGDTLLTLEERQHRGEHSVGLSLGLGLLAGAWLRGRGCSRPDEDFALFISREVLCVDEFGFEILQVGVIHAKLPLQCPVRRALPLAEEGNHLIENRVKVHLAPSCPCRGDSGPTTAHHQVSGDMLYISQMTGKGKPEVLESRSVISIFPQSLTVCDILFYLVYGQTEHCSCAGLHPVI
jgi:hypothetical protein